VHQDGHAFPEVGLGKLPDNSQLLETMLSQLDALHLDAGFDILHLGKHVNLKSNNLVDSAQGSQAEGSLVNAIILGRLNINHVLACVL